MKSRSAAVSLLGVVGLLVSGVAFQRSEAFVADPAGQQPAERQTRAERRAERETRQLTDPGKHLAFDVRPRDHRTTTRYVLEITHPSGQVVTQDLKKPPLQRRTISVPVPELPPGKYKLVIIAESRGAVARSEVLAYEVR